VTELKPAADEEPVRPERVQHWAGNRYTWWQLLAVIGWMRDVVAFPDLEEYRCPSL
jgi:hypothetical protein